MLETTHTDTYKFSRLMYIIEAALEYFIAIAVSSIYLAKIAAYIGIQDGLTAILSGFVSIFIIVCAILMIRKATLDIRTLKNEEE